MSILNLSAKLLLPLLLFTWTPGLLWAQVPPVADTRIQNESNDDVREIKLRDEAARQAELDDTLRLPNRAERTAQQRARVESFAHDVGDFESLVRTLSTFRPNGAYSTSVVKAVQKKSKDMARNTQRMLAFLDPTPNSKILPRDVLPGDSIENRTGLLCLTSSRLDPKLHQLLALERRGLTDSALRQEIVEQLKVIAALSKENSH